MHFGSAGFDSTSFIQFLNLMLAGCLLYCLVYYCFFYPRKMKEQEARIKDLEKKMERLVFSSIEEKSS